MEGEVKIATRLIVNDARFRELAAINGFKNVDSIGERAKELGKSLSPSTIYSVLGNGNFLRDSLERLAEVTGVDLHEFVSFEPESQRRS